ncbi:DUF4105 domain-containing protein [Sulfurimonas sp.]|uniref:Lnb N-terminal periplasmic domain-containing protein n=1 Tax=Sulfurimonas sp. TaxID=2022749 RepID=UPI003564C490
MDNEVSEIDDSRFFLSKKGKTNAKDELHATLEALLNEKRFDDNSTACRFPARKSWLKDQLNITDFPQVSCTEYDKILKRLNPKSATLVFPSAHINSPASMFGHTFLRINSAYKSKLLSYAINYAADANPDTENGVIFAIKGLFGGYYGKYSLLPYYEKLKEYRDTEQRDIWEYDLNLNEEEVQKMVEHMWELNGTHSNYYFFTENCSYNMLWFIEIARPSVHLREYFNYQVIPLETAHASLSENLIKEEHYRASKRTILLKYESLLKPKNLSLPRKLVNSEISIEEIIKDNSISTQQKMYILESSIEFLEYSFSKNDMNKQLYLEQFHNITKARAALGKGNKINIAIPANPINSHRGVRATAGFGSRDNEAIGFLGIRPAYHSLEDSNYGFLRGTEIEFMDVLLSYSDKKTEVENATIISIVSIAQRSEFFDSFSWRTKFGWDKNFIDDKTNFISTLGAGYSWGNELAFTYIMIDPLFYYGDKFTSAVGGSIGVVFDKYKYMSTNIEATRRVYDTGDAHNLVKAIQSFRLSQNIQLKFKYDYKERYKLNKKEGEETYQASLSYYF